MRPSSTDRAALLCALIATSCGQGSGDTEIASQFTSLGESVASEDSESGSTDSGAKLDVLGDHDLEEGSDECGADNEGDGDGDDEAVLLSIIWIANSSQGTVSKVDTTTATELARYRTGPGWVPDPSRTSVNLAGEVAVANRSGSLVKIAAGGAGCVDQNGDNAIYTSTGPDDVLDWGNDECVLWYHDIDFDTGVNAYQGGPRAVAWDAGTKSKDGCDTSKVWVGWRDQPNASAIIRRVDGRTGETDGEVVIPNWTQTWGHGLYGGATDAQRNFWGLGTAGTLVRVEADTFVVTRWTSPDPSRALYGIALDSEGNPWFGGWDGTLWHFDVATETWEDLGFAGDGERLRGLAIDQNGQAWLAQNKNCALVQYDTLGRTTVADHIDLPNCREPVGVSVDADGFVWVVDRDADMAYKVNPDTHAIESMLTGLVTPYTYSDMTGVGLDIVVNPGVG